MVDTYHNVDAAFEALEKECYKPKSSTSRTTHKVEKVVALGVGGAVLAAGGAVVGAAAAPLTVAAGAASAAAFTLPHLPAIAGTAAGAAAKSVFGSAKDAGVEAFHDRKDIACVPRQVPLVDRAQIKSLLRKKPDGSPLTLAEVRGRERGHTEGAVDVKDLLESIVIHYQFAMRMWKEPPYTPGIASPSPHSCQQAEDLYRKFVEVDYHLSKMMAYSQKLKEVADAYVDFCKRNAYRLEGYFDDCKKRVKLVLQQDDEWHRKHCHYLDHCYRTEKSSRMLTKKVA